MIAAWKQLTSLHHLEQLVEKSKTKPVVIFKHSTRCGVSSHAMHKLETNWQFKEEDLHFYYLDLLSYRNISNEIADRFNVVHQSPQIIIVKNGKAVFDISHQGIDSKVIEKFI